MSVGLSSPHVTSPSSKGGQSVIFFFGICTKKRQIGFASADSQKKKDKEYFCVFWADHVSVTFSS